MIEAGQTSENIPEISANYQFPGNVDMTEPVTATFWQRVDDQIRAGRGDVEAGDENSMGQNGVNMEPADINRTFFHAFKTIGMTLTLESDISKLVFREPAVEIAQRTITAMILWIAAAANIVWNLGTYDGLISIGVLSVNPHNPQRPWGIGNLFFGDTAFTHKAFPAKRPDPASPDYTSLPDAYNRDAITYDNAVTDLSNMISAYWRLGYGAQILLAEAFAMDKGAVFRHILKPIVDNVSMDMGSFIYRIEGGAISGTLTRDALDKASVIKTAMMSLTQQQMNYAISTAFGVNEKKYQEERQTNLEFRRALELPSNDRTLKTLRAVFAAVTDGESSAATIESSTDELNSIAPVASELQVLLAQAVSTHANNSIKRIVIDTITGARTEINHILDERLSDALRTSTDSLLKSMASRDDTLASMQAQISETRAQILQINEKSNTAFPTAEDTQALTKIQAVEKKLSASIHSLQTQATSSQRDLQLIAAQVTGRLTAVNLLNKSQSIVSDITELLGTNTSTLNSGQFQLFMFKYFTIAQRISADESTALIDQRMKMSEVTADTDRADTLAAILKINAEIAKNQTTTNALSHQIESATIKNKSQMLQSINTTIDSKIREAISGIREPKIPQTSALETQFAQLQGSFETIRQLVDVMQTSVPAAQVGTPVTKDEVVSLVARATAYVQEFQPKIDAISTRTAQSIKQLTTANEELSELYTDLQASSSIHELELTKLNAGQTYLAKRMDEQDSKITEHRHSVDVINSQLIEHNRVLNAIQELQPGMTSEQISRYDLEFLRITTSHADITEDLEKYKTAMSDLQTNMNTYRTDDKQLLENFRSDMLNDVKDMINKSVPSIAKQAYDRVKDNESAGLGHAQMSELIDIRSKIEAINGTRPTKEEIADRNEKEKHVLKRLKSLEQTQASINDNFEELRTSIDGLSDRFSNMFSSKGTKSSNRVHRKEYRNIWYV